MSRVRSTRGIAVTAGEDHGTATKLQRARLGAAMWGNRRSSVVCAVMRRQRCGDSSATLRTKLKAAPRVPIEGEVIDRETKSSGRRGRAWNEAERTIRSSEGRNRAGDEIRWTMRSERGRADEIEQQTRAGEIKRMKSQRASHDDRQRH
jgi:hypothetical protein